MRNGFRHLLVARSTRVLSSMIAPALIGALLPACGGGNTAGTPTGPGDDAVKLTPYENFSSSSKLVIPPVMVAAEDDLTIDWSALSKDIQLHAVSPTDDINDVSLIRVKSSSPTDVAQWLNLGELDTNKVDLDFEFKNTSKVTSAKLSQFTQLGGATPVALDPAKDFKTDSGITYLMVLATGTQIGFGARMMTILAPDDSSHTDGVMVTNTSATLSYTATFHDSVPVAADTAPVIDWSGVTENGAGQEIGPHDVDSILLGFYKNKSVTDLQTGFLNLQEKTEATGGPTLSWHLEPKNTQRADLAGAMGRAQEAPFANFETGSDTGTWLLGMFCSGCQNPAPVIVTILEPK